MADIHNGDEAKTLQAAIENNDELALLGSARSDSGLRERPRLLGCFRFDV